MNKDKISYLVLSDIHLGHNINKTEYIVTNLRTYFKKNHKLFKTLDMIFIAGDIFDKLLITSGKDFVLATEYITELILYCKANNIALRVLEGTPSHDWQQAKVITTIIDKLNIEVDYKYIETIYIEKNDKLGINILYTPDEYKHKAKDTYTDVKKLLLDNQLQEVDITIMHGSFNYQLPIRLESNHDENDYLNITKYYINIGHIHTSSVNGRILAQGSFDRLAHNEEEDKGGIVVNIYKNGDMDFIFINNTNAMIFKTYRYNQETIEDIIVDLNKNIKDLPLHSNIRIITSNNQITSNNIKALKQVFPLYTFKIEKNKDKEENKFNIFKEIEVKETFAITKDNIEELMVNELHNYDLTEDEIKLFKKELKCCLQ